MIFRVIMSNLGYVWLLVSLLFLLAEITTPGLFFFVAFAIGCLIAAVPAFMGYPLAVQCIVSLVSALVALWVLRKKCSSIFKSDQELKTNYEALADKQGFVIKEITPAVSGKVKVQGEFWTARTEEGWPLEKGVEVKVVRLEGNCLIVKKRGAS